MSFTVKTNPKVQTARTANAVHISPFCNRAARLVTRSSNEMIHASSGIARRDLFMSVVGLTVASQVAPAFAEGEYETLLGYATPPTSYGGYGGNADEEPKYTFEHPANWKREVPSKVEKGTQGIDSRVVSPKSKDLRAFVITLGRAGEDNKSFKLTDIESTFAGFAGADYNLQDALSGATDIRKGNHMNKGVEFFDYDIDSAKFRYLSSIAVKNGKVFALFVRCPAGMFKSQEDKLKHIIDTFTLL